MKIQIVEKNDSEIKFSVQGISPAFANSLRRVMMTEIPTMAIEFVDFKKNNSVMIDELMANRLGQIPLSFDRKAYNIRKDCVCKGKGCSRCQVELVLKKKGPGMVYSEDLKSKSKDVRPVFEKIPITELFEGEELQFEAVAELGFGKDHVKWQAAVVGYKYLDDVFTFNVESVSGISPEEIVISAAEVVENKFGEFEKNLRKLK